eukprot:scaffold7512_cov120-Isochrysis_galbana.AAC.2
MAALVDPPRCYGWRRCAAGGRIVVFDVDHTLVEPDAMQPALQRPIPSVCQLLSDCLNMGMGVQCIIVTARLDSPVGRLALGRTGAAAGDRRP